MTQGPEIAGTGADVAPARDLSAEAALGAGACDPADPQAPDPAPIIAAPKELRVEIHKPKPVHSWREFFTELGTIVLGIIIAISLEQLVEARNWHNEVQKARGALRAEIGANTANYFMHRMSYKNCIDRQIGEAEAILADLKAGRAPGRFTSFHITMGSPSSNSEWEAQRSAQTLAHFPQEEVAMMGRYYAWLSDFQNWTARETDRWIDLAVLRDPPSGLGPSDFARLQSDLGAVRHYTQLFQLNSFRVLKVVEALGIPRPAFDEARRQLFCSTNEEDYLQQLEDREVQR